MTLGCLVERIEFKLKVGSRFAGKGMLWQLTREPACFPTPYAPFLRHLADAMQFNKRFCSTDTACAELHNKSEGWCTPQRRGDMHCALAEWLADSLSRRDQFRHFAGQTRADDPRPKLRLECANMLCKQDLTLPPGPQTNCSGWYGVVLARMLLNHNDAV